MRMMRPPVLIVYRLAEEFEKSQEIILIFRRYDLKPVTVRI